MGSNETIAIDVLANNSGTGYFAAVEKAAEPQNKMIGYYNATKFTVEGMTEVLWQEVEPSGLQADWAGRSANESKMQTSDYAATGGAGCKGVRTGRKIVKAIDFRNPPHRLLLCNNASDGAMFELPELHHDFSTYEAVTRGIDFPKAEQGKAT